MKFNYFYLLTVCVIAFFASNSNAGDFYVSKDNDKYCFYTFKYIGKINAKDHLKIISELDSVKKKRAKNKFCSDTSGISLWIDSEGGDVEGALSIGRVVREYQISVSVPHNSRCFSSCVYILAAGVDKSPVGKIGIHRTYFYDLPSGIGPSKLKDIMDASDKKMISYLQEMNIPPSLYFDAQSIPPEGIKILTDDEIEKYRLSGEDIVFSEIKVKKMSEFYNTSMAEYRRRDALSNARCSGFRHILDKYFECRDPIMIGIDKTEYLYRQKRTIDKCTNTGGYKESVDCHKKYLVEGR